MKQKGKGRAADHPRIRGEHRLASEMLVTRPGSSPHTRGALHWVTTHCPSVGIIPAYAGSTVKPTTRPWCRAGSSPHTRGALCRLLRDGRYPRIIPAYAGSTSVAHSGRASDSDHPRIRGEHRRRAGRGIVPFGSSPHTRGARWRGAPSEQHHRIIPAYAGSTGVLKLIIMD